jgi:hypothetical protein
MALKPISRLNLLFAEVQLLLASDQPVAKAYTYTGQHNRNTKTNIHASSGIQSHNIINQAAKTYALDRAATRTGN